MNKMLSSQAEFSKGARTPEEAFDRQLLSGNYMLFLIVGLFLVVGIEGFVGLMSTPAVVAMAALVGCLSAGLLAGPLFWEVDTGNRAIRRLHRAAYFPIRLCPFIISKWKLMAMYGGVLWLFSLVIQLIFGILFGFGNILLYQGVLAAVFVANMIFYTIIGTVGARLGE
jgi:hypothetical protein